MKLTVVLADAVSTDAKGLASVLGLGVTRLNVTSFPAEFRGAVLVLANPEAGDEPGMRNFEIKLTLPGIPEPILFASGDFLVGAPRDLIVMSSLIHMNVPTAGDIVFQAQSREARAETHLLAVNIPTAPDPSQEKSP
ncbi:MAG: hypothetical protein MUC36_27030 [Planctomycetes bacterium]|nr:hypothetical protein [Planctomycetota bacterium]